MAFVNHPNSSEIKRVPGYLYWGTTSLASEDGYGTLLGFCEKGVDYKPNYNVSRLPGPYSEQTTYKIFTGDNPQILVVLQNHNATVLGRIFPGLASTTTVTSPGSALKTGANLATTTFSDRLLFVPLDKTNNPCFLAQKATGNIEKTIYFSRKKFMGFPAVFDVLEKSANSPVGKYYFGPIAGGTLV